MPKGYGELINKTKNKIYYQQSLRLNLIEMWDTKYQNGVIKWLRNNTWSIVSVTGIDCTPEPIIIAFFPFMLPNGQFMFFWFLSFAVFVV